MQDSSTNDMIFDVPTLIEFLSGSTTLLPGTVILTGTPSGVGDGRDPKRYLQPGDKVESFHRRYWLPHQQCGGGNNLKMHTHPMTFYI